MFGRKTWSVFSARQAAVMQPARRMTGSSSHFYYYWITAIAPNTATTTGSLLQHQPRSPQRTVIPTVWPQLPSAVASL